MTEQFATADIRRDRFGRPLVVPPGGGPRVAYRRTTTFVGALEDTYALQQWKQRQVAIGLGQRPDLVLAAAATDPEDKDRLNEIVEKATEHATASATTRTPLTRPTRSAVPASRNPSCTRNASISVHSMPAVAFS